MKLWWISYSQNIYNRGKSEYYNISYTTEFTKKIVCNIFVYILNCIVYHVYHIFLYCIKIK